MEILEGKALRRRRAIGGGIAGVTVGAVILASALIPTAANAAPGDESASSSRFLSGSLLLGGVPLDDVVSLAGVETSNNGVPTPDTDTGSLDLTALNALNLEIPGGLSVPLSGFLQLGAVNQYSQSSDAGVSRAATGAVNDSGVVDTTGGGAYPANASLNLQGLLGSTVTAAVADLDISLEAISSEVSLDGAGVVARDYNVAGGDLQLTLPAVGGLATTLTGPGGVASTVDTAVATLAGPNGLLAGALATLNPVLAPILGGSGIDIAITTDVAGALNTVLDTPVGDGVVTVNLRTGAVGADLDALLADTTGHGLNGLGVNEEVLSTAVLNNLITRVGNVLETVPTLVQTALTSTLNAATLNVNVAACVVGTGPTCTVPVVDIGTGLQVSVVNQTLGSVVAGTATATVALKVAGAQVAVPVGTLLGALTGPLNTTLFGPTGVIATVIPTVTTAVTSIVTALDPVVGLLNGVVSLRGNVQPDNGPIYSQEAFVLTVGDVLGTGGVGTIVLAHAQAGPNALAAIVPTVDAAPTVQAGTNLPVTGSGWPANTDVAVTVTAPGGGAVAGPVTLTTDGAGGFTGSVPIPVGTTPGAGFTVTATDGTSTATDTTEVTAAAAIDAAPAVQAGTDLLVSGTNWPANTQLSVQLTAPGGGANIGGPESVTTDGSGSFTFDYPVPAGTPAAAGYTVTATVGTQTATDTTEVTDAPVAAIDAAATVQAGTDLAVSGTTWPANTLVSVQLTAPGGGANVGGPATATTNGAGEFTLAYPVPASAVPGTAYTVTATAGAVTAIDTTEVTAAAAVDAAPTVQAGTSLPLTGTGWPANTDVAVQLTAPGGGDVGGPETVTTDGTGGFTLDYPVPGGAVPGPGYTVTATVGTQTATDTTEVTAAAAVDAADTVQAGASLPITGTGWPANTDVTVQLTAPGGGANVGGPLVVTTDGSGGFTADYPVPANTPPATGYTVTATVGGQTATDTTEVTAAATVDAAATVEAGTNLAVSGTTWPANTDVTVQLTAPGGAVIGTPQVVTTGGLGGFALQYPVPAGTPAGTGYTVTASVGAQTATDTTEVTAAPVVVDAAASVPAGTNLAVTGTGWPVNSSVSLQLTAPGGGANVGGPVTATTDGFGAFTVNYPVPAETVPGTGYTLTATSGAFSATDTTEVTAGDPGDVNTNAAASASASADATADGDPSAQAAAVAAALADATSDASAAATVDATSAAQAAATTDASTTASTDVTSTANASAAVAAQAAAQADASDDVNADASTAADANSAASSESAATADSSTNASSEASANTNAAASASASADATADGDPSAQAAAESAAFSDATAVASAAADASAESAAEAAALTAASTDASTTSTSTANASAAVAAQAAAQADASDDVNADASTAADANSAASSESAATADSSTNASSEASANTNAAASASASANADASTDAIAESAAQAAAFADATAEGSAAADPAAQAAAESAATATSSTAATADATSEANAGAAIAAQAAALADASTDTAAEASAASDASTSAASNASAAAIADASTDASSDAVASADASAAADPSAEVNTNASASASASAQADDDSNASVEAAAVAAALADATSTASAAADVTADASAAAAATDDASTDASTTATTDANASSAAAAQAAAQTDATSTSAANASASADADPNASAAAAANASSSATASASAAADASATATASASADATAAASASADAAADPTGRIAITIKVPVLERGALQTAVGTGFQPGETVTGVMTSDPIALGTQVADAQGTVTFTWKVPSSTDLGTHVVTLTGASSGSVSADFRVVASGLATTGGEIQGGWIALAALLLMLGLGATRIARSRRPMVQTE
ncbi:hypothetical protein J3D45_001288 [Microbacterium foliorum]|uniref:choice-of-anchor G family protein n=1 Tax=Microbacterium foliorum TaxID=104336 RepID=UPI00209D4505|nr:choice-of-anchor G family protein [Microbacterium foliorum]MCP1428790.1 hypothetical protein [Microbacterium foliorum]